MRLFADPMIKTALLNTVQFAFISFIVMIPLSLVFATLLSNISHGSKFFSTISYLPCVLSTVVSSMLWVSLLNSDLGPINKILTNIGLSVWAKPWLSDPAYALIVVGLVHAWLWTCLLYTSWNGYIYTHC